MGISVYYNLNHHCFKCSYSPQVSSQWKIGHTDKFGRYYLQYINSNSSLLSKIKFRKYRRSFKVFLGDKLIKVGNLLSHTENTSKNKNNWYMWRK